MTFSSSSSGETPVFLKMTLLRYDIKILLPPSSEMNNSSESEEDSSERLAKIYSEVSEVMKSYLEKEALQREE